MNPLQWLSSFDALERHWHDSGRQMMSGLDALMGALGVSISTDKTVYRIGESPTYRISGGLPNGRIAWTSFRNGQPTGEFQADYPGEDLSDSGTATITAGPWKASDVGDWQKQILIVPADYTGDESTLATAQVSFTVSGSGANPASTTPGKQQSSVTSFFDSKVDLPVVGKVPLIAVAGVGIGALFLLSGRKK